MASSSSSTCSRDYDVFLSFRGPDTRQTIVSHLYKELCRYGISTFKDDRKIEIGDSIPDQLIKAIKTCPFAIVVLSETYAASTWCLEELRLIMEQQRLGNTIVVPIFYGVKTGHVRYQSGSFATAFASMRRPEMDENVLKWRDALTRVPDLFGFDSTKCVDDATMIEDVVRNISDRLYTTYHLHDKGIFGMSGHMEGLSSLLQMESEEDVRFVGILGMAGVGKTTIAKFLYDRFLPQFSAHCFLQDIKKTYKQHCLLYMQEQFLTKILGVEQIEIRSVHEIKARLMHRKVFVVLDDVDQVVQLHGLAKDHSWFGPGSRIIITTRDKGLLDTFGVETVYMVKCLDQEDSLEMFKQIAFGGGPIPYGFESLLISRASQLAHGLPLAIKDYSLHLQTKTIEEWERAVDEFENAPHETILVILRSSYERLASRDKIAFLHVACIFNGDHFLHVTTLIDDGESRINNLIEQSLVDITSQGCINMHNLVEQMGREIVLEESNHIPQRQRILWDPLNVYDVLHSNTGREDTEGLALHMCEMIDVLPLEGSGFKMMHNVKFLKFYTHLDDTGSKLQLLPQGASLPRKLKLLHWDAYPLPTLPSDFIPRVLVELTLRYSNLQILSNTNLDLRKLKRLDVSGSKDLRELPDLSRAMQLEELILEGCRSLTQILMPSGNRYTLRKLDLSNCDGLRTLPAFVSAWILHATRPIFFKCQGTKLKFEIKALGDFANLSIEGDIKVRLQKIVGDAEHLSYITEQQNDTELSLMQPLEMQSFRKSLEIKRFNYSKGGAPLRCASFLAFSCLVELKLINLNIHEVPNDIGQLHSLEKLYLTGNDFKYLPTTLESLDKLIFVNLCNCRKLEELPNLTQLQRLKLSGCTNLRSLPGHDQNRYHLLELDLDKCKNVQSLADGLGQFTNLMLLDLSTQDFQTIPRSITEILPLRTLCLNNCKELKSLKELPLSLSHLNAHACSSLETVCLPLKHSIKHLDLSECSQLNQHEELMIQFLTKGQHEEEASLRFACIPGNEVPSYFDRPSSGFTACIMVTCKSPFHIQFPVSSYSWNLEANGVFRFNLRPNIYRIEEQEAATSYHLIIIQILSSNIINHQEACNFLFKPELQFSQDFSSPPVEIKYHKTS